MKSGRGLAATALITRSPGDSLLVMLTVALMGIAFSSQASDAQLLHPTRAAICGDAAPDVGEACDDGNIQDGDGCSSSCRIETGFSCTGATASSTLNALGNGDFETTPGAQSAWTVQSAAFASPLCDAATCGANGTSMPAAGTGWAWFGGSVMQESAAIEQTVEIAPDVSVLRLDIAQTACDSASDILTILIDANPVLSINGGDPACATADYRIVEVDLSAAAGGPYNDGLSHTLRIEAQTFALNGRETNFFIDNVTLPRGSVPPVPSVCAMIASVCHSQTFDPPLDGNLSTIGWTTFSAADSVTQSVWGTSDDARCHSANGARGNFTGGAGEAACIDSDALGAGLTDAYLCSEPLALDGLNSSGLRFAYSYQVFGLTDSDDGFDVLAGTVAPDVASIASFTPLLTTTNSQGTLFGLPGATASVDLSAYDGTTAYVCFRYRGDFDWSAQVDDVLLTASNCGQVDSDADGVLDAVDNCTLVANPNQIDSNADGFGNLCDADIAGIGGVGADDCRVNLLDLGAMRAAFGSTPDKANWNPHADLAGINGGPDGQINVIDLGRMRLAFFQPPGPSAAECQQ